MIRFSAALVVVGLGLLLAGAIASEMTLVYAAIAVSVCAALVLAAGMIAGRHELFGRSATAAGDERTDRGVTPGPGTLAIPGDAARTGLLPLADRSPVAASARADPAGPNYTGVGWPSAKSQADELWARVDAELSAAGASAGAPKLTKESPADEIWGRVEQELASPTQWNPRLVIPAAEETVPAEQEPAVEAAASPAWTEPPAWAEPPAWSDGADRAGQPVTAGLAGADLADDAGTTEASITTGQDANDAQPLAPAESTAGDDAAVNRWSLKPAVSAAADQAERDQAEGDRAEQVQAEQVQAEQVQAEQVQAEQVQAEQVQAEQVQAEQVQAEQVQAEQDQAEQDQAEQDQAEQVQAEHDEGIADAEPAQDQQASDQDASDEAASSMAGAAPDMTEAAPDVTEAAPDMAGAAPDMAGAAPVMTEAAPDVTEAAPDTTEAASDTRSPDEDADAAGAESVNTPPAGDYGDDAPASASPQALGPQAPAAEPAAEPGHDPGPELLAAPLATGTALSSDVSAGPGSPAAPDSLATADSPAAPEARAPAGTWPSAAPGWPDPGRPADPATQMMPAVFQERREPGSAGSETGPGRVIVVSGVPRYHRPGCILIRFLGENDVESTTREAAEASGCVPCRACQPDKLPSAAESGAIG